MAKKVTVAIIDDIDGRTAADETVEFAVDGISYEIDLSSTNAEKLRNQLSVWVEHGRKISWGRRPRVAGVPRSSRAHVDREQSNTIRQWARKNGYEVSARGRIPGEILDAYYAAN